jgi:hypothetical protein
MKELLKELFPPDIPPIARWRLMVFGCCIYAVMFGVWAVSPYGFAWAGDQEMLEVKVKDINVNLLEQSLFDAKESECASTTVEARRFFSRRVIALSREYQQLAKVQIGIPPCRGG